MKIMFIDETGDHNLTKIDPQYPIFSLNGVIFEKDYYYTEATKIFHEFKKKYFQSIDIILRSYDIRHQNPPFHILFNEELRKNFFNDLNNLVQNLKYTIISVNIRKHNFKNAKDNFKKIDNNPYTVSINFIIERFIMFLDNNNDNGLINIESRGEHYDKSLYRSYMNYFYNGTSQISSKRIQEKILNFAFYNKQININGLQLADLISTTLAQKVLGKENRIYPLIKDKILSKNNKINGIGLKIFPK
jgi:hypothetical protein